MPNQPGQKNNHIQKPDCDAVYKTVLTDFGQCLIRGPVSPGLLYECHFQDGLCCFRPSNRQHKALIELSGQKDGIVFVTTLADTVVSYVTFHKPDFPWWVKRCFSELLELGSIETDLSWRKIGLGTTLLDSIFKNPDFTYFENYIVISLHTVYGWDMKNTGLTPWDYRRLILSLFQKYGFAPFETKDPEIKEHPCNILLARIGGNIDAEVIEHFTKCCLGKE